MSKKASGEFASSANFAATTAAFDGKLSHRMTHKTSLIA